MKQTNEIVSNRARHEVITMMILQQNDSFQSNMQTYYEQKAMNQTLIVYPKLQASFLKLIDMIQLQLEKHRKKEFEKCKPYIKQLRQFPKSKNIEVINFVNETVQSFLLAAGVTDFVNTKKYDSSKPEEEDEAKGLG